MRVVIIQTAFIGDVILSTALIESLYQAGHTVGYVVKPEAAPLLEKDERIAALFVYDKRGKESGLAGLYAMSKRLRAEQYDAAVIPHRSLRSALLAKVAGIPRRIGFSASAGKWFLTDTVRYEKFAHEIIRNHQLLSLLGITGETPLPRIQTTAVDEAAAQAFYNINNVMENALIIGFGAGSKWFTKQWGLNRYSQLAEHIMSHTEAVIVCFSGKDEQELGEKIKKVNPKIIFNSYLGIRESIEALKKVAVVVTNDNGLMHLAAAAGTPVIAIFGPTVPEFGFSPVGDQHTILQKSLYCRPCSIHGMNYCPEKHFRCMNEITPEEVFEVIKKYIIKPPDDYMLYEDDIV